MNFSDYYRNTISVCLLSIAISGFAQSASDYIEAGRQAFLDYDFGEAARQYGLAAKKLKKETSPVLEKYEHELSLAAGFLDRVEKIMVLDSIAAPMEDFFKAYRLPSSAGHLSGPEGLPFRVEDVDYVFSNEDNDFKMWSQPDSTGYYHIVESIRLTDGSWHQPEATPEDLGQGANAEYPFMMADGVTLYFASDGEGSMGGYDIFVATRDAATGEYLQPQNIGMPYNSPYDDYLMAIDELNGVGWWATDRNQLDGHLTVYVYRLNDLRTNYDPDAEEDIEDKARIADFKATQTDPDMAAGLLKEIASIKPKKIEKEDFRFPMGSGLIYTSLDDFHTSGGRSMMQKYLAAERSLQEALSSLVGLRRKYASSPSASLKDQIRRLESSTETAREEVRHLRSEVYRAEGKR